MSENTFFNLYLTRPNIAFYKKITITSAFGWGIRTQFYPEDDVKALNYRCIIPTFLSITVRTQCDFIQTDEILAH